MEIRNVLKNNYLPWPGVKDSVPQSLFLPGSMIVLEFCVVWLVWLVSLLFTSALTPFYMNDRLFGGGVSWKHRMCCPGLGQCFWALKKSARRAVSTKPPTSSTYEKIERDQSQILVVIVSFSWRSGLNLKCFKLFDRTQLWKIVDERLCWIIA